MAQIDMHAVGDVLTDCKRLLTRYGQAIPEKGEDDAVVQAFWQAFDEDLLRFTNHYRNTDFAIGIAAAAFDMISKAAGYTGTRTVQGGRICS